MRKKMEGRKAVNRTTKSRACTSMVICTSISSKLRKQGRYLTSMRFLLKNNMQMKKQKNRKIEHDWLGKKRKRMMKKKQIKKKLKVTKSQNPYFKSSLTTSRACLLKSGRKTEL
jgi:hypothetical protein